MSGSKKKASVGSRILLIIYALGLIMIGLKPLKEEYQRFVSDYKISPSKAGASARARLSNKLSKGRSILEDFFIGTGESDESKEAPRVKTPDLQKEEIKDKKLDKLNDKDREELQKLIEGL